MARQDSQIPTCQPIFFASRMIGVRMRGWEKNRVALSCCLFGLESHDKGSSRRHSPSTHALWEDTQYALNPPTSC